MPLKRRQAGGLHRVLGTAALFSTAYGNVGSSIYYALGLVTVFALGLTPVAFVISGAIFFFTAVTYAEATARFPEAGGSSSFTRHAFNEAVSFFAGWAQMLNYTVTIAISAIFVPHYLAIFGGGDTLRTHPVDIIGGGLVVVLLAGAQHRRREGGGGPQHLPRAGRPRHAGAARRHRPLRRLLARHAPVERPPRRHARRGATSSSRSRSPWWPTPASRRSRTWPRRRSTRRGTSRARSCTWSSPCSRSTRSCRRWRCRRCRSSPATPQQVQDTKTFDCTNQDLKLGDPTSDLACRYANDPVAGLVKNLNLPDDDRERARVLRRDPCGHDPDHRDQRRDHRRLAADLLDGPAQTVTRGAAAHPPALLHAVRRDRALQRRRGRAHARELDVPREPVRLRRDALVHARPRVGDLDAAHDAAPTTCRTVARSRSSCGSYDLPLFAVLGGLGTLAFWLVTIVLHFSDNVAPVGLAWLAIGMVVYVVYRRTQGLPLTVTVARAGGGVRPGRRGRVPLDPPAAHLAHHHRRDDGHRAPAGRRVGHEADRALSDPGAARPLAGRPDGRRRPSGPSTSCARRRRSEASTA